MASTLVEIGREKLLARLDAGELVLVDALAPLSYAGGHLPGATNIPPDRVEALARRRIPSLDTPVVVYCAGPECDSSVDVARQLVGLGYRNVAHYRGGKKDWTGAGLPLESARAHAR
jgi:rhodanese-related sulfurtransferase